MGLGGRLTHQQDHLPSINTIHATVDHPHPNNISSNSNISSRHTNTHTHLVHNPIDRELGRTQHGMANRMYRHNSNKTTWGKVQSTTTSGHADLDGRRTAGLVEVQEDLIQEALDQIHVQAPVVVDQEWVILLMFIESDCPTVARSLRVKSHSSTRPPNFCLLLHSRLAHTEQQALFVPVLR